MRLAPIASAVGLLFLACSAGKLETKAAPTTLATAPVSAPSDRRAVVKKVLPSNVRVFLEDAGEVRRAGSGVAISNALAATGAASFILTNAHLLDTTGLTEPKLKVVVGQGPQALEYEAEFVVAGELPGMDLALLRLPGVVVPAAELALDDSVDTGDDVVVVAAPFGHGLTVAGGMVSQLEWDDHGTAPTMLKTDAAVGYGSSGGGIFSARDGRLLGIVEGYRTTRVGFAVGDQPYSFDLPMPGETFAAPVAKVRKFLSDVGMSKLLRPSAKGSASR